MRILQYFAQRRMNKALMKALASEVTSKLDSPDNCFDYDRLGLLSSTMSNDAYAEALCKGMKSFAKSDSAAGHDDNSQYVQLSLDGSPLADSALFGRPLSNSEVTARLDVTTSRITPEHPYVEFDEDMQEKLNAGIKVLCSYVDRWHTSTVLHTEDVLSIIELLEEVKRGIEE